MAHDTIDRRITGDEINRAAIGPFGYFTVNYPDSQSSGAIPIDVTIFGMSILPCNKTRDRAIHRFKRYPRILRLRLRSASVKE